MLAFIVRRILWMIPSLIVISMLTFAIIHLAPTDFATSYALEPSTTVNTLDPMAVEALRDRFGLNDPYYIQYLNWARNMLYGDFGESIEWHTPVADLIWPRLGMSMLIAISTLLLIWVLALPIGIYAAVRKNSFGDYLASLFSLIGMATPSFMLVLIIMYILTTYFNFSTSSLFSPDFINEPWNLDKPAHVLRYIWIPVAVLGISGAAALAKVIRANLLDELSKPYVITARAKGLNELALIWRYPLRIALNPFISSISWILPGILSGEVIVSSVLNLQTVGPLLLHALKAQDMFLAGAIIMLMSTFSLIANLLADIMLAWLDPRVEY